MQERVKHKTRVTVDVDTALVAAAAAKGLDLGALLEQSLRQRLQGQRGGSNAVLTDSDLASIEAHNRLIAEHGTLTEAIGKFVK